MRAALYTRVSTEDQAKEGYSLDAQMKRLEAYCQVRGWDIGGKYRDEGCSGRDTDRPEYRRMICRIRSLGRFYLSLKWTVYTGTALILL